MDDFKYSYLAGMVDGDGTVTITKQKQRKTFAYRPSISIHNTSKELIDYLCLTFEGSTFITCHPKDSNRKTIYRWRVMRTDKIVVLLEKMLPYLVVKKERAEFLLTFCKSRLNSRLVRNNALYTNVEHGCYEKLSRLNKTIGCNRSAN